MRLRVLIAAAAVPLLLFLALPLGSPGAGKVERLQGKIAEKRRQITAKKGRERALSGDVAGLTARISRLQGDITELTARHVRLQAELARKRAQLVRTQERLRAERVRLNRLRARLAQARAALAARLVQLYKADEPDVVTVVLEADGFADLLERTEFMRRISEQDGQVIERVRAARAEAIRTERRLDRLEERQTALAQAIEAQRDEVARVRATLVVQRDDYRDTRARKADALASTRVERQDLEGDLSALEAEEDRVRAALAAAAARAARASSGGGGGAVAGPAQPAPGGRAWPVGGPVVSGFGMRWGRLHAGVDIAVPSGTPIRAMAAGRVVLLGWTGGYGNYTCIQHSGALSTCYAHQSRYATSNGASVRAGQVIGYVGCTGHCFGDHLHFETRVNGSPVDPMGYL